MHCDVAVVGAGAAGIAAAVAAATAGANVVIVERHGFTGGLATAALVGTICGLYYRNLTEARFAVQGFAREFAEVVQAQSQTQVIQFAEGLHFLPYSPAVFHQEAVRQLQQAGVSVLLPGLVTNVQVNEKRISSLWVQVSDKVINISSGDSCRLQRQCPNISTHRCGQNKTNVLPGGGVCVPGQWFTTDATGFTVVKFDPLA